MPIGPLNPGSHGAHGPVKPFKFVEPRPSQNIPFTTPFDDDGDGAGWWAGAQQCFASVALAAALIATAATTTVAANVALDKEEIPAGNLYGQPDEDYWQNPSAPIPVSHFVRLPLGDPEEIPAGKLYGQPDEDYWQNPAAPIPFTEYQQLPLGGVDVEEIPAGNLHGLYEDDSWLNRPPFAAPLLEYVQLPLGDPEEIPAGNLHGLYEDDSWLARPPFSVPALEYLQLPLGDPEEIPAGNLHGLYEDDSAAPFIQQSVAPVVGAFADTDEIFPPAIVFLPDEDVWVAFIQQPPPAQKPITPWSDDDATSLYGQPDEDYWTNWVAPVSPVEYQRLPLGDVEEIPAGSLHGQPDEDFYQPSQPWPALQSALYAFDTPEYTFQPEEDYWSIPSAQFTPTAPITLAVEDDFAPPPPPPVFQPDEDYWQNLVALSPISYVGRPPYAEEEFAQYPATSSWEEEYWLNLPASPQPAYSTLPIWWGMLEEWPVPAKVVGPLNYYVDLGNVRDEGASGIITLGGIG